MLPAVALAHPEERAVLEERDRVGVGDPGPGRLAEEPQRASELGSCGGIFTRSSQVWTRSWMQAVAAELSGHQPDLADQEGVARVARQVGPPHGAAAGIDDPQPDLRVGLAGAGIPVLLDLARAPGVVEHRQRAHGRVVELHEGDPLRVGAPPEGRPVAIEDLLEVDPVGDPVPQVLGAAGGQGPLRRGGDVHDVQVVVADEGDGSPVRAELRVLLGAGMIRQPDGGLAVEGGVIEIVVVPEQEALVRGVHVERRLPGDRPGGALVQRWQPLQASEQRFGIVERARSAGRGLDLVELPVADLEPVLAVQPGRGNRGAREHSPAASRQVEGDGQVVLSLLGQDVGSGRGDRHGPGQAKHREVARPP